MRAHNFATVLGFEVRRTLLRPSFWVASLAVPALMAFLTVLMVVSNTTASATVEASRAEPIAFTYADDSGIVRADVAERWGGRPSTDPDADAAAVREGRADLFVAYPADPARDGVTVIARDKGLMGNGVYGFVATEVLRQSAEAAIGDPALTTLVSTTPAVGLSAWKDGEQAPGLASILAPGVFLVLLYLVVLVLGSQMLNITVEEKENRVTEMILTTLKPTVLIVGKVVAVLIVGVVQMLVVSVPLLLLGPRLPTMMGTTPAAPPSTGTTLPSLAASDLVVPVWPMVLGALLFLASLVMFAGLLVAIGAVLPTAKEASSVFGIVIVAMFLPLYAGSMLLADPWGIASRVLTFFPLTAPVMALLRNATGSLDPVEGLAALAVIGLFAWLFLAIGIRLFREGSISYGSRMTLPMALANLRRRKVT